MGMRFGEQEERKRFGFKELTDFLSSSWFLAPAVIILGGALIYSSCSQSDTLCGLRRVYNPCLETFDSDGSGRLEAPERAKLREHLKTYRAQE